MCSLLRASHKPGLRVGIMAKSQQFFCSDAPMSLLPPKTDEIISMILDKVLKHEGKPFSVRVRARGAREIQPPKANFDIRQLSRIRCA